MAKVFQTMDGNQAAAYTSYAFTEVAGIYPITPSSPMAEYVDLWASQGKKNLFGTTVNVVEMQSEAGAAGTVHGSLQAGALTTTFTASQGLLLKVPNMYKIAGELLPNVIHVAARSIAAQALSIFGDHQDVYAARMTGYAMLASGSVQEVMDLGGVAHLATIKSRVPFLHFFDGFRTSHELQTVEVMDYEVYNKLIDRDAVKRFRQNALNPEHPVTRGTAQNDDIYFQSREAQNKFWNEVPDVVANYMEEISKETGRTYKPFVYYGAEDATDIIVAMGSVSETIKETVDYLVAAGKKVGFLQVHLYRPFSEKFFFDQLPASAEKLIVLDRTKEPGAVGEPLYLDVVAMFNDKDSKPEIIGGRYGLSSKDTTPSHINAVYEFAKNEERFHGFTVGINDDVTNLSIDVPEEIVTVPADVTECLFYGYGSDGTIGANKSSIKLIGDKTDLYSQGYFAYDSKKSGGVTRSNLRFGKDPIRSTYMVASPHFVACSRDAYLDKYDMLSGIREGGTFLLNTVLDEKAVIDRLPAHVKSTLAAKNIKFYIINAVDLALEIGLGNRTNTIMQSAFFKLNQQILDYTEAQEYMKVYAKKLYGRKGDEIVEMNYKAIDAGADRLVEVTVDPAWATGATLDTSREDENVPAFVKNIVDPVNNIKGYDMPVSSFVGYEDGTFENGTTAYEKRGIADFVPKWVDENCIQCNQCAYVCPHAVIRPFLIDENEMANAPEGVKGQTLKAMGRGMEGLEYRIQVSSLDCTGCELCVNVCPGKKGEKALEMVPLKEELEVSQDVNADFLFNQVAVKDVMAPTTVKGSQFQKPLFEFSGACAGCGETPYVKLVTQLFGDRMMIANATGCSSIYGGSAPATPYTVNKDGHGPAWANSLFEDNAEFGYGMAVASESLRNNISITMQNNMDAAPAEVQEQFNKWLDNRYDAAATKEVRKELVPMLEGMNEEWAKDLVDLKDHFTKKSQWIIGGDGWAYDIGYGGLDHVIANNLDVNILVLDTEVYSNTGGQSSKASRSGSIAKFTAGGKAGKKKDLAAIAMSYGHVYVGQISMGYNQAQTLKAIKEAEAHDGPSIIIAYSPCIAHGIKGGMGNHQAQEKLGTEAGYWPLYRYNPALEEQGKNPFVIDSKEPNWDLYDQFLMNERRYAQLKQINPEHAEELLANNKREAQRRYTYYKRLEAMTYGEE
jgi:pyruvate-ferredoxin/flavodoxin oxidoreductase